MVTGTFPSTASMGEGVTVKLLAVSSPILLHEASANVPASAKNKNLVCIIMNVFFVSSFKWGYV